MGDIKARFAAKLGGTLMRTRRSTVFDEIAEVGSRAGESPFRGPAKLVVHCSHHKAGTLWLQSVLQSLAGVYDLPFKTGYQHQWSGDTGFFLQDQSEIEAESLPDFVGSHLIRDPRDMAISAYFYHLWCKEPWVHEIQERYGNTTLQKYLKSLPQDEGIAVEIRRGARRDIRNMKNWNYDDPRFIEVKYETLFGQPETTFRELFTHYGFHDDAISLALDVADKLSFNNRTKRSFDQERKGRHMRSGKPGQWRDYFTEAHKEQFKELHGDLLVRLGYEPNNDW